MREYFCAYHSMLDATRRLSDAEVGRLFRGLLHYSMTKEQPQGLQGREEIVFDIYSQQIDRDIESYERQVEINRENGKMGGRPRKNPPGFSENRKNRPGFLKTEKTQDKDKDKDKGEGKDKDKGESEGPRAREARFSPPTVEEVTGYAREKGWGPEAFSPERFVTFYASKGWRVGCSPMKDWKAAARGWVARQRQESLGVQTFQRDNPALDYEQREYRAEDFGDGFFVDLDQYGGE